MINNISQFKTLLMVQFHYNNENIRKFGNLLQIQDSKSGVYHYLVENMQGYNELPVTSISGEFFTHEEN